MNVMEENSFNENSKWVNVQEPVKDMILAIAKSVRTQSAGIRDLDRKLGQCILTEKCEKLIHEGVTNCLSKKEGLELASLITTKSDDAVVSNIESNLLQVSQQLARLNEVLTNQNNSIRDLNRQVNILTDEVNDLKTPNYDPIFSYIDRQIQNTNHEFTNRLNLKCAISDLDSAITKRVEETSKPITQQIQQIHRQLAKTSTNEDLQNALSCKTDLHVFRHLANDVANTMSKQDLQSALGLQMRPILTTLSAMEKTISLHEEYIHDRSSRIHASVDSMSSSSTLQQQQQHQQYSSTNGLNQLQVNKIQHVVDVYLSEKYPNINQLLTSTGDQLLTRHDLDLSCLQQKEYLVQLLNNNNEEVKLEQSTLHRENTGMVKKLVESKMLDVMNQLREVRDTSLHTRTSSKELAANVAKALAKKVDRSELKRAVKEIHAQSWSTMERSQMMHEPEHDGSMHYWSGDIPSATGLNDSPSSDKGIQNIVPSKQVDKASPRNMKAVVSNAQSRNVKEVASTPSSIHLQKVAHEVQKCKKDTEKIQRDVHHAMQEVANVKTSLNNEINELKIYLNNINTSKQVNATNALNSMASTNEMRVVLGDMSLNLRREMAEKCSREEMLSTVQTEREVLLAKIMTISKSLEDKCSVEETSKLDNTVSLLRSQIAGELTGARWLWTSSKISRDGWIPWDTESQNAAPSMFLWRRSATSVTARMPGLYRVSVCVFTTLPSAIQLCVNGEPVLSLQPDMSDPSSASNSQALREERYVIRRLRHSLGDVTSLSIDEHVSLPAESVLSVRFHSASPAQAFLSIKKL